MYPTTTQYDNNIYGQTREIKGKIEFEIIDVDAYKDAGTITVTGENALSDKSQTQDLIRNLSAKYATFEEDKWVLDGSFVLPPKPSELSSYQVGWWSNEQSQADKTFSTSQVYTRNFNNSQDMIGVTVIFDQESDEYAEDFTIQVYDGTPTLIDSISVTGNTLSKYIWDNNLSSVRQVVITITKWANAYRWARITEVDWGIIQEYTDDEIIRLDVLKEVDTISNTIAPDETSFILDNQDQEFNILNPTGIYPFLQKRQKIIPYYGLVNNPTTVEWIPMGIFYLTRWNSDQGSLTASFIARDFLDLLNQQKYRKGKVQTRTAYDLAEDILSDFGLETATYNIDSALSSITLTGNIPVLTHKQALQIVANASQSVVYVDRVGVIQIKQLTTTASVDNIDFDNVYEVPKIELAKRVNTVEVAVNEYNSKPSSEEIYKGIVSVNGTQDVWIEYKEFPATSISSVITGASSVNSETYYGNAGVINVTATGNVTITTTGTVQERAESIYTKVASDKDADEDTISVKVNNPLIATTSIAEDVADWVLADKQDRFVNKPNWRMNPAHEIGDRVIVEDDFSEDKISRITKNQYRYDGALSGTTWTKGGDS